MTWGSLALLVLIVFVLSGLLVLCLTALFRNRGGAKHTMQQPQNGDLVNLGSTDVIVNSIDVNTGGEGVNMNTNMVTIIKRIIAEQGEAILGDTPRLKGLVADYASRESKVERLVLGRCIEYGAYAELKGAMDREAVKAAIARRVHANEGLDIALCNDALDALEAALFDEKNPKKVPQNEYPDPRCK
jgi:hypothetical protein